MMKMAPKGRGSFLLLQNAEFWLGVVDSTVLFLDQFVSNYLLNIYVYQVLVQRCLHRVLGLLFLKRMLTKFSILRLFEIGIGFRNTFAVCTLLLRNPLVLTQSVFHIHVFATPLSWTLPWKTGEYAHVGRRCHFLNFNFRTTWRHLWFVQGTRLELSPTLIASQIA